ncbi:dienelactone hydrolase family protein [Streptomyces sp. SID12501]|uniref:Dienelactone hydrolase family protein n=1 Tax=Streptomyces sp. SID12501 TaxID=2706042 RepID=A0A6B3BL56_9ACTN|nr:dienelactone hydrolase family protein [Streptomyces sp. SID12501]NEC85385.1 dienelactone hydrolase family protein [Streptomyces sp. SID12501]
MSEPPQPTGFLSRQNVTFPSADTTAHGYLALPPSGSGPGVIRGGLPGFSGLKAEVLGHYGELDESIPVESLDRLREAIEEQSDITPDPRVHPAYHAFFNDSRPVYDAESATRAWESTVPFLKEQVR